ncbi:putative IMP-specific 5'-nucleotidase 1 [Glarea lozoyensis 74030]|uniref:IMP-specific 5'-nucleotidase 1 n=1 Tax=Glarea lozoyensis (strain ATCC 74030 / MF5533) TaxID=1104152 RepID=H0EL79_GLAL7|nr:putative IMP-specific 5'-nucleotidase 1 [Glarea lozoyensis 74030]
MRDVEGMIDDHNAFEYQDKKRFISSRRFVPPSFNDVRLILNTAQLMGLTATGSLDLATFDGDVTLYDDGQSLLPSNPVIQRIIDLMSNDTKIGIVTAAGYTEAEKYHGRLHGLLTAVNTSTVLTEQQKNNLIIMAESSLRECVQNLSLAATVLRKERAVGIIPTVPDYKFPRESLEETVLVVQKKLEMSEVGRLLPFCAFNGGNDVFVDIGDKSWGVLVCQNFFGSRGKATGEVDEETEAILGERTLHVGDQFLSAGSNDFKARVVGTTAWIANPTETVELLDELVGLIGMKRKE